jgi:hypothetical protein
MPVVIWLLLRVMSTQKFSAAEEMRGGRRQLVVHRSGAPRLRWRSATGRKDIRVIADDQILDVANVSTYLLTLFDDLHD